MLKIFITATNTDIGKTYTSEKLLRELSKYGYKVGYFKPFESGVNDTPLDGSKLLEVAKSLNSDFNFTVDEVVPYQFELPASIYVAKGSVEIDYNLLINRVKEFENSCDVLIVEGAGGLMVPIDEKYFLIDLISIFDIDSTLLVTSSKLGSINDTLLSMSALSSRGIDFSWVVNLYLDIDSFDEVTMPYYKNRFKKVNILQNNITQIVDELLKNREG